VLDICNRPPFTDNKPEKENNKKIQKNIKYFNASKVYKFGNPILLGYDNALLGKVPDVSKGQTAFFFKS
jgi:hypothetical protein